MNCDDPATLYNDRNYIQNELDLVFPIVNPPKPYNNIPKKPNLISTT